MLYVSDLVYGIHDAALAISASGEVTAINEAAERLLGHPPELVVGRRCAEVVRAVDGAGASICQAENCPVLGCIAAGAPVDLPWVRWQVNGGHDAEISASAIVFSKGSLDEDTIAILVIRCADTRTLVRGGTSKPSLRLLGRVALEGLGGCIIPRRRRTMELLALLGLAGARGAHRDEILDALWPSGLGEGSSTYLRVLLTDLRHTLAVIGVADGVERAGNRYLLRADALRIDALEFQSGASVLLHAAVDGSEVSADAIGQTLALYDGDLAGDEDFGVWVLPERERVRQLYLDVLDIAVRAAAASGDAARVVEYCQRALGADPLQERFQVELVAAYGQLGRFADALRQYRAFRDLLGREAACKPLSAAFEQAVQQALMRSASSRAGLEPLLSRERAR